MTYLAQIPLSQVAALYLITERFRARPPAVRTYFQKVFQWLPDHEGAIPLTEITTHSAKRLRDKAARERGTKFGNHALAFIQAIVADAKEIGVLPIDRVRCVSKLRTPALEMRDRRRIAAIREIRSSARPAAHVSKLNG